MKLESAKSVTVLQNRSSFMYHIEDTAMSTPEKSTFKEILSFTSPPKANRKESYKTSKRRSIKPHSHLLSEVQGTDAMYVHPWPWKIGWSKAFLEFQLIHWA